MIIPLADFSPGGHWSHTLGQNIDTCMRLVFLRVYGGWGGWKDTAPHEVQLIYRAKKTRTLHMHCGVLVHEIIRILMGRMRTGMGIPPDEQLIARIGQRFMDDVAFSASRRWEKMKPKQARLILTEHFTGQDLDQDQVEKCRKRAQQSLGVFLDHYLPILLKEGVKSWESLDSRDALWYREHYLYIVPDVLQAFAQLMFNIIDWKTGSKQDIEQLATYALYLVIRERARNNRKVRPEDITAKSIPLCASPDEIQLVTMSEEALEKAQQRIDRHIDILEKVHPYGENFDRSAFPKTDDITQCEWCLYRFQCEFED